MNDYDGTVVRSELYTVGLLLKRNIDSRQIHSVHSREVYVTLMIFSVHSREVCVTLIIFFFSLSGSFGERDHLENVNGSLFCI